MKFAAFAFATALASTPVALFAQNIQDRKVDQQGRIAQGARSGQPSSFATRKHEG